MSVIDNLNDLKFTMKWYILGDRRKFKHILKYGPLSEVPKMMGTYLHDIVGIGIEGSIKKILNKYNIDSFSLTNSINDDGTFSGNVGIITNPFLQDFFASHGINWQNSFTEEQLKMAKKYREFISSMNKKDCIILSNSLLFYITKKSIQISEIFDDDCTIKSTFFDLIFSVLSYHFFDSKPDQLFSNSFIINYYGKDICELMNKLCKLSKKDRNQFYISTIHQLITNSTISKDIVLDCITVNKNQIHFTNKFYEIIDPFLVNKEIFFINSKKNKKKKEILPELHKIYSPLVIKLIELPFAIKSLFSTYSSLLNFPYYIRIRKKTERIDFEKVFRFSKNGKIMFNESNFDYYIDKIKLVQMFLFMNMHNKYIMDEYDYDKLGISRAMVEFLIKSSINDGDSAKYFINRLFKDKFLLNLDKDKTEKLASILEELSNKMKESNCRELNKFFYQILGQLISNSENYEEKLTKIENVFTHNNLPEAAKRFLVYKIMYPEFIFKTINFNYMSPTLTNIDDNKRDSVILEDLIRIAAESNNRSLKKYLFNIERGNLLYSLIASNKLSIEDLDANNTKILQIFLEELKTLYNQTKEGKENIVLLTGDLKKDLDTMSSLLNPDSEHNLLDRIVQTFTYSDELNSFNKLKELMEKSKNDAEARGRRYASEGIEIKEGDFLKGIGDTLYLYDILQNGSLAKEFLGAGTPGSDSTPLDTDVTRIGKEKTLKEQIDKSYSKRFGPIWFIIKNDDRFKMTREECKIESNETHFGKEVFTTNDQWGIRTGFGSCDIDCIIINPEITKDDLRSLESDELERRKTIVKDTKFAIALNGFYIPVYDKNTGKLLFTPKEFDEIREKMQGLSNYGCEEYKFSSNLDDVPEFDNDKIINDSKNKKECINSFIAQIVEEKGLRFSSNQSEDLEIGGVDLIDTGSTGRGTNIGVSSDFDFIMRIDVKENSEEITKAICEKLDINYEKAVEDRMVIGDGNLRLKKVSIPGIEEPIDLDISYVKKDEIDFYSTDECLKDRLETIKRQDLEKYERVLDNIRYAKKYMKENGCYKPSHSREKEGGMGGVGIENWILQNGGSFTDACRSFIASATTPDGQVVPFEVFKSKYKVYDFGKNFFGKKYDEFVSDNMTVAGYRKMVSACREYIKGQESKTKGEPVNMTNSMSIQKSNSK